MVELDQWLESKQGKIYRYKMEKIQYALDLLGHPERELPVVHVAGTNGKGSTIAFLNSLLVAQGFRVGTFVSPHMITVHDRICINGQPIPDTIFQALLEKLFILEQEVEKVYEPFRYFEVLTLVMLLYFKEEDLDFALVEVGIGGLLDTTNVVEPLITIITSVGLDHQDLLGDSLVEIAEQKAGIIKENAPIIVGPVESIVADICQEKARNQQAPIYFQGQDFLLERGIFRSQTQEFCDLKLGLIGQHQEENASLAIQAFSLLMAEQNRLIENQTVQVALEKTQWAGRLERVGQQGRIYLDGAHNLPAIERLVDFIQSEPTVQSTILFSALKRKDFGEMLDYIEKVAPQVRVIVTSFAYDGGIEEIDCPEGLLYEADYERFIKEWESNAASDERLFITGSLYFISEIRKYFQSRIG
ncbi:bifunctional folylpolyglutamate synthase/dihydrofolate synthase [Streptococcus sp. zg-86]|uniref:tetrahydrofolate synthase n=1 Tax=Streptococcus zhangguiae TaxID=2664091 RepID=A0A6I4RRZ3_9STRE|nr:MULTISPECIES: folylpolyglutamate synthase/dihydrofolate synthase family protein [unclassified Streptococcus]MTB63480.1 bifunctional folylpolyglutamate synthase/dihydrofolate synthase [Streptococcus sp. zg-86]MTB89871.1 bifunctional folylpolyglutamate synthase/dihydrofolate synthase [Streptococcus sp. zg-36]MWV55542.1 bifunctional folylpolyglutamate synthase/dihydrofolate synthase [Streptococcus sp. zg-70]QTH47732.1 bifunctional folylpolyglutamate synthase/dihydrofolate synthase [Streptococcu